MNVTKAVLIVDITIEVDSTTKYWFQKGTVVDLDVESLIAHVDGVWFDVNCQEVRIDT